MDDCGNPTLVKTTENSSHSNRTLKRPRDPVAVLRTAIEERSQRNPGYSLRAFARASGISHTVLSLVLSGKRPLSKKAALKLADYLELDPESRQNVLKPYESKPTPEFSTLSLDAFSVISDWYHYAILSLMELPDAKLDARWIAKRIGISVLDAKMAIERLQRLELLVEDAEGRFHQRGLPIKIDNTVSTAATRRFHKQVLARAAESIEKDDIAERDFSSMTFAMDVSSVEFARERIREFRRQLTAELEMRGTPQSVYYLTVQLFPVAKTEVESPK